MAKKENKTNAMRILETNQIPYEMYTYECDEFIDGMQTASLLQLPPELLYKTLVTVGKSKDHYVFVIPIQAELDFKKAAKVVNEKSLEMLSLKYLTQVTGYVRGGCTSIGMKKQFRTILQEDAMLYDTIIVSGGRIGLQLRLHPDDLCSVTGAAYADVIRE